MSHKTSILFSLFILLGVAILTVSLSMPVQAQSTHENGRENNCMNCHENLYFLHDTGNWFCLRESPMLCVDCHGGNPEAATQEMAHLNRVEHPVVNDDVSKCQECHPQECSERVELFDQTAGISQILVAAPYSPAYSTEDHEVPVADSPQQETNNLLMLWEVLPVALVTGLALVIYFVAHRRHN